jgi:hypothetical protein
MVQDYERGALQHQRECPGRTEGIKAHLRGPVVGHVHLDQGIQREGLTMLTTPATCFQGSTISQTRKTLPGPPGFRMVQIKGGEFSTRVLHLPDSLAAL